MLNHDPTEVVRRDDDDRHFTQDSPPWRRRWWVIALAAVIALGIAWAFVAAQGGTGDDATIEAPLRFAEVVRTDLVEVTTLDGTLGRAEGDTITSPVAGIVTSAPEPGDTIEPGDTLYEIDDQPVILFAGDEPAYRALSISADSRDVVTRTAGTITAVAEEGTPVGQGDVLFEIDGEPVVALFGSVPAYRTMRDLSGDNMTGDDILQLERALVELGFDPGDLDVDGEFTDFTETMVEDWQAAIGATEDGVVDLGEVVFIPAATEVVFAIVDVGDVVAPGQPIVQLAGDEPMEGDDVAQLEAGLGALGYDPGPIDGVFDGATKAAVLAWQSDRGLEEDGVVDLGEIVFLADAVRVATLVTPVGAPVNPGGVVLTVTSSDVVVTAELPAADQDILEAGMAVTVELPDGTRIPGTVDEIDSVATRNAANETVFAVTVLLDDPSQAGSLDEAPVDVDVVTDSVADVMAVPVTALLALAEGGYAVEVDAGDGRTQLVPVEPGFFADGMVEIRSDAVTPGDRVVVP